MISRRHLLRGMGALLAAPAIVRAASLMPVRSLAAGPYYVRDFLTSESGWGMAPPAMEWSNRAIGLGFAIMQNGSRADATIASAIAAAVRAEEERRVEMLILPRPIFD